MPKWLILVHRIPPRPLCLRAKIRQRLAGVGAVAVKNAIYLLPSGPEALEDLQWIAQENFRSNARSENESPPLGDWEKAMVSAVYRLDELSAFQSGRLAGGPS